MWYLPNLQWKRNWSNSPQKKFGPMVYRQQQVAFASLTTGVQGLKSPYFTEKDAGVRGYEWNQYWNCKSLLRSFSMKMVNQVECFRSKMFFFDAECAVLRFPLPFGNAGSFDSCWTWFWQHSAVRQFFIDFFPAVRVSLYVVRCKDLWLPSRKQLRCALIPAEQVYSADQLPSKKYTCRWDCPRGKNFARLMWTLHPNPIGNISQFSLDYWLGAIGKAKKPSTFRCG